MRAIPNIAPALIVSLEDPKYQIAAETLWKCCHNTVNRTISLFQKIYHSFGLDGKFNQRIFSYFHFQKMDTTHSKIWPNLPNFHKYHMWGLTRIWTLAKFISVLQSIENRDWSIGRECIDSFGLVFYRPNFMLIRNFLTNK